MEDLIKRIEKLEEDNKRFTSLISDLVNINDDLRTLNTELLSINISQSNLVKKIGNSSLQLAEKVEDIDLTTNILISGYDSHGNRIRDLNIDLSGIKDVQDTQEEKIGELEVLTLEEEKNIQQQIILMDKLGVIDALKKQNKDLLSSSKLLGEVVAKIMGIKKGKDTVQRIIYALGNDLDRNNPYNTKKQTNVTEVLEYLQKRKLIK